MVERQGWLQGRFARDLDQLADVPVPVENFAGFTAMFDPGGSPSSVGTDYVSACVRSFFAQGGKRCYVVRMGDPVPPTGDPLVDALAKQTMLQSISIAFWIPSRRSQHVARRWASRRALGRVVRFRSGSAGLERASQPTGASGQTPSAPAGIEQFVECAQATVPTVQFRVYPSPAPRLSPTDYAVWAKSVAAILQYIVSGTLRQELHLREIQFVAAFPLPRDLTRGLEDASIAALDEDVHDVIQTYMPELVEPAGAISATNLSSAFLQLAYPWLKTTGSYAACESLEPPDGALVGILARNALKRGAFTSATKITPSEIFGVWPSLPGRETKVSVDAAHLGQRSPKRR